MQSNQVPTKFPIPFGNSAGNGYTRVVPTNSQIGVTPGAASLTDGFPPVTFTPVGAGGVPPFGQDFNGLLNQITAWSRWQAAGGLTRFDSVFAASIGGYPQGAVVASASNASKVWLNTVDNNTTDPDSATASGWYAFRVDGPITPYTGGVPQSGQFYSLDLNSSQIFTLPNPGALTSGWYCDLLVLNSPSGYQTAYAQIAAGSGTTNLTYRGISHAPFYFVGGGEILRFLWTGSVFLIEINGQPAQILQYRCGNAGGSSSQGGTGAYQYLPINGALAAGTPNLFNASSSAASLAVPCSGFYNISAETNVFGSSSSYQQGQVLLVPDIAGTAVYGYGWGTANNTASPVWVQANSTIFLKQGSVVSGVIRAPSGLNFVPSGDVFNVLFVQR